MRQQLEDFFFRSVAARIAEPQWLLVAWLAIVIIVATSLGGIGLPVEIVVIASVAGASAGTAIVFSLFRHPTTPRKRVGVTVAIFCEDPDEAKRVELDLVAAMQRIMEATPSPVPFHLQAIPAHLLRTPLTQESAKVWLEKTRSQFFLFGDLRKRRHRNQDVYALRMTGMVRHAPIGSQNQRLLADEMTQVLPLSLRISSDVDLEGFEVTSSQLVFGAKYIVAIAYYLSGARDEGIALLRALGEAKREIERAKVLPNSGRLIELAPRRLTDFLLIEAGQHIFAWRSDHDPSRFVAARNLVDTVPREHRNDPRVRNVRAMAAFVLQRDVARARDELNAAKKDLPNEPVFHYALAFLAAFDRKLDDAYKHYREALKLDNSSELVVEVEEFIAWCAESDPDKPELLFCLGYLNGRKKKDRQRAIDDFTLYVDRAGELDKKYVSLAKKYLALLNAGHFIADGS